MSIGVHVRTQIELIVVLSDFDDSRQVSRLKARLENQVIGIECIGLCR